MCVHLCEHGGVRERGGAGVCVGVEVQVSCAWA